MKKRIIGILVFIMMLINLLPAAAAKPCGIYSYTEGKMIEELTVEKTPEKFSGNFSFQYEGESWETEYATWLLKDPDGNPVPVGSDSIDHNTEIWYDGTGTYTRLSIPANVKAGTYILTATVNSDVATLRIILKPMTQKMVRIVNENGVRDDYDSVYNYPDMAEIKFKTILYNTVSPVVTWKLEDEMTSEDFTASMIKNATNESVSICGNNSTRAGNYKLSANVTDGNETFSHEIYLRINRSDTPEIKVDISGQPEGTTNIMVDMRNKPDSYILTATAISPQSGTPVDCDYEWYIHGVGPMPLLGISVTSNGNICNLNITDDALNDAAFALNVKLPLYGQEVSIFFNIKNGATPSYSANFNIEKDIISLDKDKEVLVPMTTDTFINGKSSGVHHRMFNWQIFDSDKRLLSWSDISVEYVSGSEQGGHMAPAHSDWNLRITPNTKPGKYTVVFELSMYEYDRETGEEIIIKYSHIEKPITIIIGPTVTYSAKIGNKKYISLKDAVADVKNNDVIELLADCSTEGEVIISKQVKFSVIPFEGSRYMMKPGEVFKDKNPAENEYEIEMIKANTHSAYTENMVEYNYNKSENDKQLARDMNTLLKTGNILDDNTLANGTTNSKIFDTDDSSKKTAEDMLRRIEGNAQITNDDIMVVAQPFMKINVLDAKSAIGETIPKPRVVLDISPRISTVMTTKAAFEKGNLSTDEGEGYNAVLIGSSKEMEITTPVTLTIPVPEMIVQSALNQKGYITHKKENEKTYVYSGTISDNNLTFVNPHGFSKFTIETYDPSVAKINETGYLKIEDSIEDAKSGETISLVNDALLNGKEITVTDKNITFRNDSKNDITLTINGTERIITKNGGTYTENSSIKNTALTIDSFELAGNAVNISVSVEGLTKSATLYTAVYDHMGRLVGLSKKTVNKSETQNIIINHNFDSKKAYYINAMLWDDMSPLCVKETLSTVNQNL